MSRWGLGIGYFVTPDVSLLALLGVPPTTTLTGQGTLSGLTLGKVTYGPSMLTANYHFRQFGAFQPFLGAGVPTRSSSAPRTTRS